MKLGSCDSCGFGSYNTFLARGMTRAGPMGSKGRRVVVERGVSRGGRDFIKGVQGCRAGGDLCLSLWTTALVGLHKVS